MHVYSLKETANYLTLGGVCRCVHVELFTDPLLWTPFSLSSRGLGIQTCRLSLLSLFSYKILCQWTGWDLRCLNKHLVWWLALFSCVRGHIDLQSSLTAPRGTLNSRYVDSFFIYFGDCLRSPCHYSFLLRSYLSFQQEKCLHICTAEWQTGTGFGFGFCLSNFPVAFSTNTSVAAATQKYSESWCSG